MAGINNSSCILDGMIYMSVPSACTKSSISFGYSIQAAPSVLSLLLTTYMGIHFLSLAKSSRQIFSDFPPSFRTLRYACSESCIPAFFAYFHWLLHTAYLTGRPIARNGYCKLNLMMYIPVPFLSDSEIQLTGQES